MGILIQGGRIVDAATDTDKKGDIYLEDGVITEIGEKLKIKEVTLFPATWLHVQPRSVAIKVSV